MFTQSPYICGSHIYLKLSTGGAGNSGASGNVGIGTTTPGNLLTIQQTSATDPIADAWTVYSSRRWKTNVTPIAGALDTVGQLQGVEFDWKAGGKHDIGMIAEDVGRVVPEIVVWEDNGKDAKSLDYARLTAVLAEAVKELKKENDELKEKDAELEKRIKALENGGKR